MNISLLPRVVLVLVTVTLTACGAKEPGTASVEPSSSAQSDEAPVARVNGKPIARAELNVAVKGLLMQMAQRGQMIPPDRRDEFEWDVLNELINRELIVQEAKAKGHADVEDKVSAELSRVESQVGGAQELDAALKESGFTREEYRERLRENFIVQEVMEAVIAQAPPPSEEEVQAFYEQNRDRFREPPTVRARHILLRVLPQATAEEKAAKKAQIDTLRARLVQGEDFAQLAEEFSEDTGSARNGGDLGYFPQGVMVPEFDEAAFTLETNAISEVITTQFGYHILQVTDKRPARDVALAEVKDQLTRHLQRQKGIRVAQENINKLRSTAQIEILIPAPATGGMESP